MNERRKKERIGIAFPIECSVVTKKNYFYTVTKDLSPEGTKIISSDFLTKGDVLKVNLNLIDRILDVKAKVAWCNKERYTDRYSAGLEFVEINEGNKGALTHFLNKIYKS